MVLSCLHVPSLILLPSQFEEQYFDPTKQGPFASEYLKGGYGQIQLKGDIRQLIIPKNYHQPLPDIWEAIDYYFHQEAQKVHINPGNLPYDGMQIGPDEDKQMSKDTEAAHQVSHLQVGGHSCDKQSTPCSARPVHPALVRKMSSIMILRTL